MAISAAPIIISWLDSKCVYGVIMQVEIEDDVSKEEMKLKKDFSKEFYHPYLAFSFIESGMLTSIKLEALHVEAHCQTFYPSVPTPPPNV